MSAMTRFKSPLRQQAISQLTGGILNLRVRVPCVAKTGRPPQIVSDKVGQLRVQRAGQSHRSINKHDCVVITIEKPFEGVAQNPESNERRHSSPGIPGIEGPHGLGVRIEGPDLVWGVQIPLAVAFCVISDHYSPQSLQSQVLFTFFGCKEACLSVT